MNTEFNEWFESLPSMYDVPNGRLISFTESLYRCSKRQDADLRQITEGQELRNLINLKLH